MGDIEYFDTQYAAEIQIVRTLINHAKQDVAHFPGEEEIKIKMNRLADLKRSFGYEMRMCRDVETRTTYSLKAKRYEQEVKGLSRQVANLTSEHNQYVLMSTSASAKFSNGGSPRGSPDSSNSSKNNVMLSQARSLQDKTEERLDRIDTTIANTKDIALKTVEELEEQNNQASRINKELEGIDAHVEEANSLVGQFTSRLLGDRIFQFFTIANICLLCGLIYMILEKQGKI